LCVVLVACGEELPPSPPQPGRISGAAIVGQAPAWAAPANGISILPSPVHQGQTAIITILGFGAVYPKAYYYTKKTGAWKEISLQGNMTSNWITSTTTGIIPITADFEDGKGYVIVYACARVANSWDCNNNHWMLEEFTVGTPIPLNFVNTSSLAVPAQVPTKEMVINKTIPPFWILGTLAVTDNFGSIGVRRYDAKYRSEKGLDVLVYVFDFNSRVELQQALREQFADVLENGITDHNGKRLALFVDAQPHTVALWTNAKQLIYVETFGPQANAQIIERYMEMYPSDLENPAGQG